MLPTFVIGLREGLEAALIVGIIAAFVRQRGRSDLLRWVFAGVAAAVVLCLAAGITLDAVSSALPQRQQEGLETVVGGCAVAMVTYMVIWMRRHSRSLKGQLEGAAGAALAAGSGFALVVMAFLAVLREGLETVVFLLAAFNESGNSQTAGLGAVLGVLVAVGLGWAIYRGGVRLNLSKFFRFTGIVLTFVAAGLVVTALHTAHEAGWLTVGQQRTLDLGALVRPGSVQESLLTGMLGVQSHPVLIEVIGWLLYLVPVGVYVAWPPGRGFSRAACRRALLVAAASSVVAAAALFLLAPAKPGGNPVTRTTDGASARVVSRSGSGAVIEVALPSLSAVAATNPPSTKDLSTTRVKSVDRSGVSTVVYSATVTMPTAGAPSRMSYLELAQRNGGRLPLGVRPSSVEASVPVSFRSTGTATFWVEPRTGRVVDMAWRQSTTLTATFDTGPAAVGTAQQTSWQLAGGDVQGNVVAARHDLDALQRRQLMMSAAAATGLLGAVLLALAVLTLRRPRGRANVQPVAVTSVTRRSNLAIN